jgi:SNF2 family DNA or RNA helicase
MHGIPDLFEHQASTVNKLEDTPILFDMSDPGTGKTRAHLEAFFRRRDAGGGKALVLAPKSILQPAWGDDIDRFFPGRTYMVATAQNRAKAFKFDTDVYITNHDAVKWVEKNWRQLAPMGFDTLIIDESTAFKNPSTTVQRCKALRKIAPHFEHRELMTGTPNPNSVLDVWAQAYILDQGERLGSSFYKYRNAVCQPEQVGPRPEHLKWVDKPGAEIAVFELLEDISIRHKFEDCNDIPPNVTRPIYFELPAAARKAYNEMLEWALTEVQGNIVQAIHAASLNQKLLQIASGAIYSGDDYSIVDETRAELIMDLIEERKQCVVGILWRHQREQLMAAAEKRGFSAAFIDGTVAGSKRTEAVSRFQAGDLRVLFCHPASAGHGLTLTRGTTTIWASPTYNSEWYKQLFHRIYRTGQTQKTETIHVVARDTIDEQVYDKLGGKLDQMSLLLSLMQEAA